jgi:hypothetical protein
VIKGYLKYSLKKNKLLKQALNWLIFLYIKLVYATSRWHFIFPASYEQEVFLNSKSEIFAIWHNRLAFGPGIFLKKQNVEALISPHSDGAIISQVVKYFGFEVVSGSTNKGAVASLKQIMKKLKDGTSIVITPDGPRGPRYQINSSITEIARKYSNGLIPISCECSNYFTLNSWDKLIFPLPFCKITVIFGSKIELSDDKSNNDDKLKMALNELTFKHKS